MSLTAELADGLIDLTQRPLPPDVAEAARRSLLNVLATSIAASHHRFVDATVRTAIRHGGRPAVAPPGRRERLDPLWAALVAGLSAHLDDFDDTHLATMIHPGAACLGAAIGQGGTRRVDGSAFLAAFALGCEAQLRIGVAMSPWHYDEGWHITGTCGVMGATVTAGLIACMNADQLAQALGIGASQTLGIRETFGSTLKPFHPGKAAYNGSLAVLLAEQGFTGSMRVLEAPRGYFGVLSPRHEPDRALDGLGGRWELLSNTFKPYPCGIVSHPAIDAAVALSPWIEDGEDVVEVTVRCHPLVAELTGNPDPSDGVEAKFSTIHGVAAALLHGRLGLPQYEDVRVRADDVRRLRDVSQLVVDGSLDRDAAAVRVELADGRTVVEEVDHARGSLARPLTRQELVAKVEGLVEPVLPGGTQALVAAVDQLDTAPDLEGLMAAITLPERVEAAL